MGYVHWTCPMWVLAVMDVIHHERAEYGKRLVNITMQMDMRIIADGDSLGIANPITRYSSRKAPDGSPDGTVPT